MPSVRQPQSRSQYLWGGWNCHKCGCEMDKWGKEIPDTANENSPSRQLEKSKIEPIKPFDEKGKTPVERIFDEDKK